MGDDRVYKRTDITAVSAESYEEAIRNGIAKVSKTIRKLSWFHVTDLRGSVNAEGEVEEFQVTLTVAFLVE